MGNEADPRASGGQVASGGSRTGAAASTALMPGKRTLVDLQQDPPAPAVLGNAFAMQAVAVGPQSTSPAMSRARSLARLARMQLLAVESALVPAYQGAVVATDTAAVRMLVQQLVGRVAHVIDSQAEIARLVPQADTKASAALASTVMTDPGQPDTAQLAMLRADVDALDRDLITAIDDLVIKVSPQMFGVMPTAGFGSSASEHTFTRFITEAQLVIELMETADRIASFTTPSDPRLGISQSADESGRNRATEELSRWKSRPVNFYFLERVLKQRGVWALLAGHDLHGRAPAELAHQVDAQAEESGASADLGAWNEGEVGDVLGAGRLAWPVSGDGALGLFRQLTELDTDARAGAIRQLERRGLLERMCLALPWPAIKQLWEVTPDPRAAKYLEPYWLGKGDVKSLGRMLDGNKLTRGVSRFLDVATLGAKPKIDAAIDGFAAGDISDSDVARQADGAIIRAGFVGAAMAATGGATGAYAGGVALGAGLGEGAAVIADGAAAGAFGGAGGQLAGDVFDQARGDKHGFDPLSSYATTFAGGGLVGTLLAPVGLAAARYIPAGMRTIAQQAAAEHPEWSQVLEAARSVGIGTATTVRLTARELLESMRNGGPPGFRFAYAGTGGAVPANIASAAPESSVILTIRPLQDLNALPMQRTGEPRPLVEVEQVTLEDEIQQIIAEREGMVGARQYEAEAGETFTGEDNQLRENGPEVAAIRTRRTARDVGAVANPGDQISDYHHVFPQEQKWSSWFKRHGINIDDYCVKIPTVEHQAQHGGGAWRLARALKSRTGEFADWNSAIMNDLRETEAGIRKATGNPREILSEDEIVERARAVMTERGLGDYTFVKYPRANRGRN